MNKLFLTAALGVVCVSSFAQGTLEFSNQGVGLSAPVTDLGGGGLWNNSFLADLYWAPGVVTDSSLLTFLGPPASFSTNFSQRGFFFGGPRTIPGAAGGTTITAQVRVWNSSYWTSWEATVASNDWGVRGESILFQVTLADPTSSPAIMTGLNGHPWSLNNIPEPSTLALAGLGLAAMLVLRRFTI